MKRRELITLLGGAAAPAILWPLVARAQQTGKVARIGFLGSATAVGSAKSVEAFRTGLRDLGYVEGKNIVIEFKWAEGNYERLPALLAELIRRKVDILVVHGTPGTRAAKQATMTPLRRASLPAWRGPKRTSLDQPTFSRNSTRNGSNCSRTSSLTSPASRSFPIPIIL